ncbi:MAG: MFS transporter, partial [Acidimicrobiia bacterium]|nr:MFS transporter [Acidimicrobiia bacterium]
MTSGATPTEAALPYRWTILTVATVAQTTAAIPFLGVGVLAGFLQERFDLSGTETGLLVTAIGIVPLFALIPVGRFLDHHSERMIITAGALLLGGGVAIASFFNSYLALLAVLAIGGAGYSTSQPGGSKVVAAWFPGPERGVAMGIRQTGVPLGGAVAAATLPQFASRFGVDTALLAAGCAAIAGGLTFLALYRPAPLVVNSSYHLASELRSLLSRFQIRTAMWIGLAMVSAQFALLSYLMLYLRDVHDIPLATGAWVLFGAQISGVAGRILLARWSDRLRSGRQVAVL